MKSDREFLQGIYEKAQELKLSTQIEERKGSSIKRQWNSKLHIKPANLRFAMVAAVFVLLITSGVFLKSTISKNEVEKPQTFGLTPRGFQGVEEEVQIWDIVTDVIEVKFSQNKNSLEIVHVYKGQIKEDVLLDTVKHYITNIDQSQTALVLLKDYKEYIAVLDIYYSDKANRSYKNSSNEEITLDGLKEYLAE